MRTFVYHNEERVLTATWVVGAQYVQWGSDTDYDGEANEWYRHDRLAAFNVVDADGDRMLTEASTPEQFGAYVDERLRWLDDEGRCPSDGTVTETSWP